MTSHEHKRAENNMIGEQIEHYRIDAIQGHGSLGTVYRAYDTNLIRPVALKLISPQLAAEPMFQAYVLQEARAAAKLIHPNIATIYNFNNKGKHLYLVSEFVNGRSLNQLIDQLRLQKRGIFLSEICTLVAEIADALAYAHQNGVLHRNLKPSNVLLKPLEQGAKRTNQLPVRPLVTDFGLTRQTSGDVKSNSANLGIALNYMSPEHCIGNRLDGRSDIYVLGLLLYELIRGERPFNVHSATEAMIKHALETPSSLSDFDPTIPKSLRTIVNTAIAKQPDKRYQDMTQMAELLRQVASTVQDDQHPNRYPLADIMSGELEIKPAEAKTKQQPTIGQSINQLPVREDELALILQEALANEDESYLDQSDQAPTSQVKTLSNNTPPIRKHQQDAPPAQILPQYDEVVIQRPSHSPIIVQLSKDILSIGRSKENDIVLETSDVSRKHAQLEKTSAGWRIVDLNSTGGTYWGGHKLLPNVPEAWNTNQSIRIGPYSLRWLPARAPRPFRAVDDDQEQVTKLHAVPAEGIQTSSTKGQFSLMVNPVLIQINPGERGVVQVELFNQGTMAEHFSLRVVDLPPIISSLSQDNVYLSPGERATLPITLTIPNDNPMSAGHHPYQIVVRRESDKQDTAVISARLTVGSSEQFSLGIWPLDIPQNGICQILIRNEGNTHARFSVTGNSADSRLNFLGERGQVRVDPGQATTLKMTVASAKRPLFGRRQQIPFDIKVRSETGMEQSENGRLELDPHLPSWILPVLEMFIVIIFAGVAVSGYFSGSTTNSSTTTAQALEEESDFGFEFGEAHGELPIGQFTPVPTLIPATVTASFEDDDFDNLTNGDEFSFATDPNNPDTDGDGLLDGEEVGLYDTIPTAPDTDGDGLLDGEEVNVYQTNPTFADTDLDGVSDGDEVANGTDPLSFTANNAGSGSSGSGSVAQPTAVSLDDEDTFADAPAAEEPIIPIATAVPTQQPPTAPPADPTATAVVVQPTNTPPATAVPTTPPTNSQATTIELPLVDTGTGWVTQSGETSQGIANTLLIGDTNQGDAVRGFLSYDLSQIPTNADISSARLTFGNDSTVAGNPFELLDCMLIEAAEFDLPLSEDDFDAFAFYIDCEVGPPSVVDVLIDVQDAVDFELDYIQFKFSFNEETNFDTQADQFVIRSAPILQVTYTTP